ncbi:MAG: hypothetical protein AAF693_02375 [Bacteroidota bacterium]
MPKEAGDKKSKVETYEVVQVTMTMKLYNPIKKSLLVIENQDMPAVSNKIMDKYSPEVMALEPEQLIYYYYLRNVDKSDENMAFIAKHLKTLGNG